MFPWEKMLRTSVHAGSRGSPDSRCATPRRRSKLVEGNGNGATRGRTGAVIMRVPSRKNGFYAASTCPLEPRLEMVTVLGSSSLLMGPEPRCSGVRWFKAKGGFSQLLRNKGHAPRPPFQCALTVDERTRHQGIRRQCLRPRANLPSSLGGGACSRPA